MTESMGIAVLGSRAHFPSLEPRAYLAHAAISPLSSPAVAAMGALQHAFAAHGSAAFADSMTVRERLRQRLATLVGAAEADIGFVQNTSTGLAALATSLAVQPDERIGLFSGEYPSNVSVFQQVALRSGAGVHFFEAAVFGREPERALRELEAELQRGMRLLSVSAVQFQTGLRMPLAAIGELCRRHGTIFCVDGVQAVGAVPIDVDEAHIDALACGAHKWLMGCDGIGFIYIRPTLMEQLEPVLVGCMSHEDAVAMLSGEPELLRYDRPLLNRAQVFEGGMLSSVGSVALDVGVQWISELGVPNIYQHLQRYHDAVEQELLSRGFISCRSADPELRSGILSMRPPAGICAGQLVSALAERGVVCSSPDGLLRLAPHWPNHLDEVPDVAAALDDSLAALRAV